MSSIDAAITMAARRGLGQALEEAGRGAGSVTTVSTATTEPRELACALPPRR